MNVGFFVNALTWVVVEMVIGLLISRLINGHVYVTFLFASSLTLKCFFNGHIEFSQGFTITIARAPYHNSRYQQWPSCEKLIVLGHYP